MYDEVIDRRMELHVERKNTSGINSCDLCGTSWPCYVAVLHQHIEELRKTGTLMAHALGPNSAPKAVKKWKELMPPGYSSK